MGFTCGWMVDGVSGFIASGVCSGFVVVDIVLMRMMVVVLSWRGEESEMIMEM